MGGGGGGYSKAKVKKREISDVLTYTRPAGMEGEMMTEAFRLIEGVNHLPRRLVPYFYCLSIYRINITNLFQFHYTKTTNDEKMTKM